MELPVKSKRRFLAMLKGLQRSDNTISSYDLDLTSCFRFLASKGYPFNTKTLNEYLIHLEKRGSSTNTVRRHALAIRGLLRFMNEREGKNYNITEIFPKKREEKTPYIEERTDQLKDQNEPWALAVRLVELFGLRGEEVVQLKADQIEVLEGGTIQIKNLRSLTLSAKDEALAEAILEYIPQTTKRLFPFTKRLIEMKLKKFSEESQIKLSLRSLRHLAAKRMYLEKDPLIKEKLGLHTDFSLKAYEKFPKSKEKEMNA